MDSKQVKDAVSRLSDQELAQLAAQSSKAQADFVAGTLSNRDLIIILVCIAGLILIIYRDEGQDVAEYAIMLAVILVIVMGMVRVIGSNASNTFSQVASSIQ